MRVQHDAAAGGHHLGLDAVADRDLDVAVGVLEFDEVDLGLALAADADKRHLRAEGDDGAFDGLPALELLRGDRGGEHRREILFLVAHWGTLGLAAPWGAGHPM